jgi:outer membrane protein assembly factor BamB
VATAVVVALLSPLLMSARPFGVELPGWMGTPRNEKAPWDWNDPVHKEAGGGEARSRMVYNTMYITQLNKQENSGANVLEAVTQGGAWNHRELASPVFDPSSGLVLVGTADRNLYAVSAKSGAVTWTLPLEGRVSSRPLLDGEDALLGADDGGIYSVRKGTGHRNWRYQADAEITAPLRVLGDRVFAHTAMDTLVCLRRSTGEWLWQVRHPLPVGISLLGEGAPAVGVVLRADDTPVEAVFVGHADGTVSAMEAADGHVLWNTPLAKGDDFLDVDADLTYDAGVLYAAAFHGGVHALDPQSGASLWSNDKVDSVNRLTVTAHSLVLAGPRQVLAISREKGTLLWRFTFPTGGASTPVVHRGRVLVNTDRGALYVLNMRDGRPLQYYGGKPGFTGAPAAYRDLVFLLSNGGWLHALSDRYAGPMAGQRQPW